MDMLPHPSASEEPSYQQLNGHEMVNRGNDLSEIINALAGLEPGQGIAFVGLRRDVEEMMLSLQLPGGAVLRVQYDEELAFSRHELWVREKVPGQWVPVRKHHPATPSELFDQDVREALGRFRMRLSHLVSRLRAPSQWFQR